MANREKLLQIDSQGQTGLHRIVRYPAKFVKHVAWLIEQRVDAYAIDNDGHTALSLLVEFIASSTEPVYRSPAEIKAIESLILAAPDLDLKAFVKYPLLGVWANEHYPLVEMILRYSHLYCKEWLSDSREHIFVNLMRGNMSDERIKGLQLLLRHPRIESILDVYPLGWYGIEVAKKGHPNHFELYIKSIIEQIKLERYQKNRLSSRVMSAYPLYPYNSITSLFVCVWREEVKNYFIDEVRYCDKSSPNYHASDHLVREQLETYVDCSRWISGDISKKNIENILHKEYLRWEIETTRPRQLRKHFTALQLAIFDHSHSTALLLIEEMVNVKASFTPPLYNHNLKKVSPYVLADFIVHANEKVVTALLAAGIDPNGKSLNSRRLGMTALHVVLQDRKLAGYIGPLIDNGADVNAVDAEGHTPLSRVLEYFILSSALSVDYTNAHVFVDRLITAGVSCLHLAVLNEYPLDGDAFSRLPELAQTIKTTAAAQAPALEQVSNKNEEEEQGMKSGTIPVSSSAAMQAASPTVLVEQNSQASTSPNYYNLEVLLFHIYNKSTPDVFKKQFLKIRGCLNKAEHNYRASDNLFRTSLEKYVYGDCWIQPEEHDADRRILSNPDRFSRQYARWQYSPESGFYWRHFTPLQFAIFSHRHEAALILINEMTSVGANLTPQLHCPTLTKPRYFSLSDYIVHANREVVLALLDAGIDPNGKSSFNKCSGMTALHRVVQDPSLTEYVSHLIKYGADIEAVDDDSHTPLSRLIEWILQSSKKPADCEIEYAAVDLLIKAGAVSEHLAVFKSHQIDSAEFRQHPILLQMLMIIPNDPKIASMSNHIQPDTNIATVQLPREKTDNMTLHTVVKNPATALKYVKDFITHGMDVNAKDSKGHTALSSLVLAIATSKEPLYHTDEELQVIDWLIEAGATLDLAVFKVYPLLGEWRSENPLLIKKLLERGLDVNAVGLNGHTILGNAMFGKMNPKRLEALEIVLRHLNLRLAAENAKGKTYTEIAAEREARGCENHDKLYVQPILEKIRKEVNEHGMKTESASVTSSAAVNDPTAAILTPSPVKASAPVVSSVPMTLARAVKPTQSIAVTTSKTQLHDASDVMRAIFDGKLDVIREHFSPYPATRDKLVNLKARETAVCRELEAFVYCRHILPNNEAVLNNDSSLIRNSEGDRWRFRRWHQVSYGREDSFNYTPLQFAIFSGQDEIALFLIQIMEQVGANFNPGNYDTISRDSDIGPVELTTLMPYANAAVIIALLKVSVPHSKEVTCFGDRYSSVIKTAFKYPALAVEILPFLINAKVNIHSIENKEDSLLSYLMAGVYEVRKTHKIINHLIKTDNTQSLNYFKRLYIMPAQGSRLYQTPEELMLVKQLLNAGASFENLRLNGVWVLFLLKSKNVLLLKTCLENGLSPNMTNDEGTTLLIQLMRTKVNKTSLMMLEILLRSPQLNLNAVDEDGETAKDSAADYKKFAIIPIAGPDNYEKYVLPMLAKIESEKLSAAVSASASTTTVAAFAIKPEAYEKTQQDTHQPQLQDSTLDIISAIDRGDLAAVKSYCSDNSNLHTINRFVDCIKYIREKSSSEKFIDTGSWFFHFAYFTPLQYAIYCRNVEVALYLIKCGAIFFPSDIIDPTVSNLLTLNDLIKDCINGQYAMLEIIEALLEDDFSVYQRICNHETTLLHTAVTDPATALRIVPKLLRRGAKIDEKDMQGHTALSALVNTIIKSKEKIYTTKRELNVVNWLVEAGAKINLKVFLDYPLFGSTLGNNPSLVERFLHAGLLVNQDRDYMRLIWQDALHGEMTAERLKSLEMLLRRPEFTVITDGLSPSRLANYHKFAVPIIKKIKSGMAPPALVSLPAQAELEPQPQVHAQPQVELAVVKKQENMKIKQKTGKQIPWADPAETIQMLEEAKLKLETEEEQQRQREQAQAQLKQQELLLQQQKINTVNIFSQIRQNNFATVKAHYANTHNKKELNHYKSQPITNTEIIRSISHCRGDSHAHYFTPFQYAIYIRRIDIAILLAQFGAKFNPPAILLDGSNTRGPLVLADLIRDYPNCERMFELVEVLLKNGLETNENTSLQLTTALHAAVENPQTALKFVPLLLKHGANLNVLDNKGHTPLSRLVEIMLKSEGKLYSSKRELKVINWLIEAGANVNDLRVFHSWPLFGARCGNHPTLVELFLHAGIDVNHVDSGGESMLRHALTGTMTVARAQSLQMLVQHPNLIIPHDGFSREAMRRLALARKQQLASEPMQAEERSKIKVALLRYLEKQEREAEAEVALQKQEPQKQRLAIDIIAAIDRNDLAAVQAYFSEPINQAELNRHRYSAALESVKPNPEKYMYYTPNFNSAYLTPLQYAICARRSEIALHLIQIGAKFSYLALAPANGYMIDCPFELTDLIRDYTRGCHAMFEVVEALLKNGLVKVDGNPVYATTALHAAVEHPETALKFVPLLLSYGANVHTIDFSRHTPLSLLIQNILLSKEKIYTTEDELEVVTWLIHAGARTEDLEIYNSDPLFGSRIGNYPGLVKRLILDDIDMSPSPVTLAAEPANEPMAPEALEPAPEPQQAEILTEPAATPLPSASVAAEPVVAPLEGLVIPKRTAAPRTCSNMFGLFASISTVVTKTIDLYADQVEAAAKASTIPTTPTNRRNGWK